MLYSGYLTRKLVLIQSIFQAKDIQLLLEQVKDPANKEILSIVALRTMQKARYDENVLVIMDWLYRNIAISHHQFADIRILSFTVC